MIDLIIEQTIDYITEELGNEKKELKRLVEWINFDLKKLYPLQRKKYHVYLSEEIKKYRGLIDKIKEIREIFQKGKPFSDNQTKGKLKQFTPINMRLSTLEYVLKHYGEERAKEEAKKDLKSFKSIYSERTYYRFKKRIKELGINI